MECSSLSYMDNELNQTLHPNFCFQTFLLQTKKKWSRPGMRLLIHGGACNLGSSPMHYDDERHRKIVNTTVTRQYYLIPKYHLQTSQNTGHCHTELRSSQNTGHCNTELRSSQNTGHCHTECYALTNRDGFDSL